MAVPISPATGTVTISGSIKAKLTWNPGPDDQPPPDMAFVKITAVTGASGLSGLSADCGFLGATLVEEDEYATSDIVSWHTQKTNLAEFIVPTGITSTASATGGSKGMELIEPYVTSMLRVDVWHAYMELTGLNETTGKSLIGQCVKGEFLPGNFPVGEGDTYSWTVTATGAFESYTVATDDTSATLDSTLTTNQEELTACFRKPESVTYKCTVNLANPSIPNFDVEKTFVVEVPTYNDPALELSIGTMQRDSTTLPTQVQFGLLGIIFTTPNTNEYVPKDHTDPTGIVWKSNTNTPVAYRSGSNYHGLSYYVNVIRRTVRRTRYDTTTTWVNLTSNFDSGPYKLDNAYPYMSVSDNGTFPAEGEADYEIDAPTMFIDKSLYDAGEFVDEEHRVYLMYLPPSNGVGVFPVSIASQDWEFDGLVEKQSGVWAITRQSANAGSLVSYPAHPAWTEKVVN